MSGQDLKRWRKNMKWTQQALSNHLGVSLRSLVDYEQSDKIPQSIRLSTMAIEKQLIEMRECIFIKIHFPSCKACRFYSDDFAQAILDEFKVESIPVLFGYDAECGFYEHGYSSLSYPESLEGSVNISDRVNKIFNRLKESHKLI